jgi:hypothetical protein
MNAAPSEVTIQETEVLYWLIDYVRWDWHLRTAAIAGLLYISPGQCEHGSSGDADDAGWG